MFGISHKLNDHSLYMLHDIVEGLLVKTKISLSNCNPDNEKEYKQLKNQVAIYKHELSEFEKNVENQRKGLFQFSVEELYSMYGQYENKFVAIEFHKFSDSAKKIGRNIGGVLVFGKSEREQLEKAINSGEVKRTNDLVKIEVTSNYEISKEVSNCLVKNGFKSGDVYEILSRDGDNQKSYKKEGLKDIPNTINITIDPSNEDPQRISLWLFTQRINKGGQLLDFEWDQMCGYLLYYEPESAKIDFITEKAYESSGIKKSDVRFHELMCGFFHLTLKTDELIELNSLLEKRRKERTKMLEEELNKSTNKSLDEFQKEYPQIYDSLIRSITVFDDETLEFYKTTVPIYWNFKSYLHIYLRHCEELQIEGHFVNKSKFQYTQKNIKRILEISIRKLSEKINERISEGKDFRIYGERALYYNGNYYSLRIESDGRVDSFYPMEIKD